MKKYAFLLFGILVFLGILGLFLPDVVHAWGWGGGGGGGWRPPRDRPEGGGSGGTPRPPSGGTPGAGGARPPGPSAPGSDDAGKGLTDLEKNQEFSFEFIEDKEADYHRQATASMFAAKD